MKQVVIIQSAMRYDFRKFLLMRKVKYDTTRIEQIERWISTVPTYAVESWEEAIRDCRKWNRFKHGTVHFPHQVMFFDKP